MRRIAVIATCLIVVLGFAQPASADSVKLIKGFWIDDSTGNWPGMDQAPCGGTNLVGTQQGWYLDITNPTPEPGIPTYPLDSNLPAATRSWQIDFAATPSESDSYAPGVNVGTASQLQTLKMDVNGSTSGQSIIYAWNQSTFWAGKVALTKGSGWSTVDASGLTYTWYQYNNPVGGADPTLVSPTPYSGTVAAFETDHGGAPAYGYTAEIGFGCDNAAFAFQNLQYGAPGSVTTDNFSSLTDKLAIGHSASKVVAGTGVRINGDSKFGYVGSMRLQARPLTSSTWSTIATVPVGARHCSGTAVFTCWSPFSKVVYPKVSTAYRWVDPGTIATDPGTSSATTVFVATRVSATWPAIYRGRTFAVNGTTYPAKPGAVVTLYGKHGTTVYNLGHATVTRTGTFRVSGIVHLSGTWSLWITIPARTGDVAGRSATRSVFVH